MTQNKQERLHAIDGLRTVAACLVVAHHLGVASAGDYLTRIGFTFAGSLIASLTASGVELFFVLSAIVLVRPYMSSPRTLQFGTYALRRAERLWPPYIAAWLLAGLAVFLASAYPTWWTTTANLPSFHFMDWASQIGIIYFGSKSVNFAWWSLVVEVAFYVLVPILIPVFRWARFSTYKLTMLFGIVFAFAVGANFQTDAAFFLSPVFHKLAIYSSCFCAGLVLSCQRPNYLVSQILIACGVFWLLFSCLDARFNQHSAWGLIYFGIVAIAMDRESVIARKLSSPLFLWVGERSYSLFLVHYSVIGLVCHATSFFVDQKSLGYFILTRVVALFFSLLATILIFHFVERRFARNLVTANFVFPNFRKQRMISL